MTTRHKRLLPAAVILLGLGATIGCQAWRSNGRDDAVKSQMASDPHSPSKFRVIGPLRNIDAWYNTFNVTSGTYFLKPDERARIW